MQMEANWKMLNELKYVDSRTNALKTEFEAKVKSLSNQIDAMDNMTAAASLVCCFLHCS